MTEVFLANPNDFELHDISDYEKIKEECLEAVYKRMCKVGLIKGTDDTKELFELTNDILVALSRARRKNPLEKKDLFSFTELEETASHIDKEIAPHGMFKNKLALDRPLLRPQGNRIKEELRRVENFHYNEGEITEVINKINDHLRSTERKRHRYWAVKLYNVHTTELLSICLGLDVLEEKFIDDAFEGETKYIIDVQRHHADEDKEYYVLFSIGKSGYLQMKLIPLTRDSHWEVTQASRLSKTLNNIVNEKVRQKYFHIYKLLEIPYDNTKPDGYYEKLLREEFDKSTFTFKGVKRKLWDDVDGFFKEYFDSWLLLKKKGSFAFFMKYYPIFYKKVARPMNFDYILYLEGDPNCENPDFWYWFTHDYIRKNLYPIHRFPFKESYKIK